MTRPLTPPRLLFVTFLTVGLSVFGGCGSDSQPITSETSKYEVDEGDDAESRPAPPASEEASTASALPGTTPRQDRNATGQPGAAPRQPSATPPAAAVGPAGDKPADLMAYVSELVNREPTGTSRDEVVADFVRTQDEIIGLCERVFAMDESTAQVKLAAAETKVRSLSQMSQLGDEGAAKRLEEFVVALNATNDESLQHLGFQVGFSNKMEALRSGQEVDPATVMEDLTQLVETETQDLELLRIGSTVAAILDQAGHTQQATAAFRLLADTFQDADDEVLRENAAGLAERAALLESGITTLLSEMLEGKEGSQEPFIAASKSLLQAEGAGLVTLDFFQQVAPTLEVSQPAVAEQVYNAIGAAFQGHANEDLAEMAEQIAASYKIRSSLVGQPLVVEGKDVNGQELDWSQYEGKVVLVDFWATESLVEMNNVRENYDRYHEQGFEVIGVNLDNDMQALQRFLSFQKLPWPSVVGTTPETRGWNHPMVKKYGVSSVPFLVLVGRDGHVLATNLRGEALGQELAKLFPSDAQPASGDADKPVPSEPVPSEPVPSEPVPSEPVPSEPVPSEPVPSEPVPRP